MKTTSVTELKKRLSAHLDTVRGGETYVVTDHKVPVAVLTSVPKGANAAGLVGLVASGIVQPPAEALDVEAFLALPIATGGDALSVAVTEEREGR